MNAPSRTDDDQRALWNGVAGHAWVDEQQTLDGVLQPFEDLLLDAMPAGAALHVLDIGCGTGSTTLAAARRLGAHGHCTGIDISEPMIALARQRAAVERSRAEFVCADAQVHA